MISRRLAVAALAPFFLLAGLKPGRKYTSVQRLEDSHLEATHEARLRFAKERKSLPALGPYFDFRAVLHIHAEDSTHTRGTRPEVLAAAKADNIQVVMFTDHNGPKPETWHGVRDGVLFIPGSEDDHLLRFPPSAPGNNDELRFLSHLEETPDPSPAGAQGMEIYNRHTDAKDEDEFVEYFKQAIKDPVEWAKLVEKEKKYPDEVFATQADYWPSIMAIWDKLSAARTFTGIAANDAHQNQIYNGTVFDPYPVSLLNVSTHFLAREVSESSVREALREGRTYVAHDWLCDPTGFSFVAANNYGVYEIGDRVPMLAGTRLAARLPIAAHVKILHNGAIVSETSGAEASFVPQEPGAYRLEAWLPVDGEERPWIYSSPIYLTKDYLGLKLPSRELAPTVEARPDIVYTQGKPEDENKHKLDIYLPKDKTNFPVLVFFHGGSWRTGDRSLYPALGNRFAKEGIAVVVPSYRLMPANPNPAQIEDAMAAFDWVVHNIAQYGGDPKRIYLCGHSAGGHLAAYVGLAPKFRPYLKGVIPLSGVYDVSEIDGFRPDGQNASPLRHVASGEPPFLIAYCQWDYRALPYQAREFEAALRAAGDSADLVYIPGRNHITEIVDATRDDDPAAQAVLDFIRKHP